MSHEGQWAVSSDQFFDTTEITNPTVQVESAGMEATPCRRHIVDQEHTKTCSWERNLRNLASEPEFLNNWHEANLQQWKETPDLRYSIYQDQQFKIAVREHQRQGTEAVTQAVRQSSDNDEDLMMQEFQSIQNRYEGREEEDPKHEMPMRSKSMNIKFFSKQEEEKNSSWKARCSRSCSHTVQIVEELLKDPEVQQEQLKQHLEYHEGQLRIQLPIGEADDDFSKKTISKKTQTVGGKLLSGHNSSVHLPPPGIDCSQHFTPTKKTWFTVSAVATRRRQSVGT